MEIRTFAETLKFKVDAPHAAIGTVNGYYATFFAGKSGFSVVPYITFQLAQPVDDALMDEVRKTLAGYRIDVSAENDVLILVFNESLAAIRPVAVDAVKTAILRTTNVLAARGIGQPSACRFCGREGADTYHYKSGVHRPVHDRCLKEYLATEEPPSVPADGVLDAASFARSVVYALAGGLLAAIPAVVAVIVLPVAYAFLLALVPLGSFAGYRAGKGVVRPKAVLLVDAYDLFLAFAAIVWCWSLAAAAAGETFFRHLGTFPVPFVLDAVIGMGMTVLGILLSRRLLPVRKL